MIISLNKKEVKHPIRWGICPLCQRKTNPTIIERPTTEVYLVGQDNNYPLDTFGRFRYSGLKRLLPETTTWHLKCLNEFWKKCREAYWANSEITKILKTIGVKT